MKKGIDLSVYQADMVSGRYQDTIDWERVKVALGDDCFVIVQLTQGLGYINPISHDQCVNAKKIGAKLSLYHFGHPEKNSAKMEADFFLSQIRRNDIPTADLIPALDIEQVYSNGIEQKVPYDALEKWVNDFAEEMNDGGFPKIMIYSNPGFLNSNLSKSHTLGRFPLWLSEYTHGSLIYPNGWNKCTILQNSGKGQVDGIKHPVDTNILEDDYTAILLKPNVS